MKLPKPIKLLNLEKKGDLEKVKDEERDFVVLFHLGDIPWEKDAKQIFLSYAEKMANLLPQESKNRLETEALSISFFPTIDDVYAEPCNIDTWNFALPFDKTPPKEECLSIKDEELKACCRESDIPFKDTFYGRIYTNMLKPKDIDNEDRVKTTGEELIEVAERLLFHVRLDIRSKAWEIAETENGMSDALRLMDWFNEFSSSFMAEIGKVACRNTDKENLIEIKNLKKNAREYEATIEELEEDNLRKNKEEEAKKKEENKTNEMVNKQPLWIKCLCGLNGNTQLLNYRFDSENNRLVFSLNKNCKNFGVLGQRIVDDSKELGEKGLDITKRGLETRLRELTDNLENVDIESPLETLAKKIRACSNK